MVSRRPKYGAWLMVMLAAGMMTVAAGAQDEITISMSLDRNVIALGDAANLTLTIETEGQQQVPEPKLPPLPQFEIFSSGSSTNFQMINGVVSYSMTFSYKLFPKKEGTFPIRSATLVYNGKRYVSNELSLKVVASGTDATGPSTEEASDSEGKAKDLFLAAEVDKKSAYVDEQVTLRVKFYRAIKVLSTPEYAPPQTPDFWTNDIPPQKQYYETINGRDYLVNEIRTALFPTKPGELTVSPARVTVTVPDRSRRRSRDPFSLFDGLFQQGKQVEVSSNPLTVTVKPLPLEGKTAQFSGGVGTYNISAAVDKISVEVNEAITLTVKISGRGNVKSIPEPALPEMDGFRVEKASSDYRMSNLEEELGGTKTFEYLLIPRLPGTHTVDPIVLNYFDPRKSRYIEAKTSPITLTVQQGEAVAGRDIPYNMVTGQTINLTETDIRFIKMDNGRLTATGGLLLTSPIFLIVMTLPLLVVLGGMIDVSRKRRLANDIGYARQRRAASEAKRRLRLAEKYLRGSDDTAFYAELSAVVYQLIADKLNLSAHGLTSDSVRDLLLTRHISDGLLDETLFVLNQADFGRFAGGAGTEIGKREFFERAKKTIASLEGAL